MSKTLPPGTSKSAADAVLSAHPVSLLDRPSYLLCPPFSHSVAVPNNVWMREYAPEDLMIDRRKSQSQFLELYHYLASEALVYLLPASPETGLQDQVFTANLAFIPEHLKDRRVAIIANFTSEPRQGETAYGVTVFEALGFETLVAPYRFEGEAEIKHLHGNTYVGGYGERTDRRVYGWMREQFDMNIIEVEERVPHFYHLDCSIFPLSREETMICTSIFTAEELKALEKVTGLVDVIEDHTYNGICNSLRLHNVILNASYITELKSGTEDYDLELAKNRRLEDVCAARGLEPAYFNLSEYFKSGALLSCLVMHLNRRSFDVRLI